MPSCWVAPYLTQRLMFCLQIQGEARAELLGSPIFDPKIDVLLTDPGRSSCRVVG